MRHNKKENIWPVTSNFHGSDRISSILAPPEFDRANLEMGVCVGCEDENNEKEENKTMKDP